MHYLIYLLLSISPHSSLSRTPSTEHHLPHVATQFVNRFALEDSIHAIYNQINLQRYQLSYEVFRYSMIGYYNLQLQGKLNAKNILSIIDFTKPSTQKRFYTIDLNNMAVMFY